MRTDAKRSILAGIVTALAIGVVTPTLRAQPPAPLSATSSGGVVISRVITEYDVRGQSVRELQRAISTNGYLAPSGRRFAAITNWNLRWSYPRSSLGPRGCSPNDVAVYIDISIRYPAWKDSAAAPTAVRAEWNRYLSTLKGHEDNHAAIAIAGAHRLHAALKDLVNPVCAGLQRDAEARYSDASSWIRTQSAWYDGRTKHGVAEGASLQHRPSFFWSR